MATGTSSWNGLGMGLYGEYELTQVDAANDLLTLTGVASAAGTLLTIQSSAKAPDVNGLRVYDYGRTRIIRTDASSTGGAFKNALDVKYDVDYAMGAVQVYAASIILDMSGGSAGSGRQAVLQLQYYGNAGPTAEATSWLYFNDLSGDTAENPTFLHLGGTVADDGGCFVTFSAATSTHALRIYVENVVYYIMVADSSN